MPGSLHRLVAVRRGDATSEELARSASPFLAHARLDDWVGTRTTRLQLATLARVAASVASNEPSLRALLLAAFERGELVLLERPRRRVVVPLASPSQPSRGPETETERPVTIRVRVGDGKGGVLSGKRYTFAVDGEETKSGRIASSGIVEREVPASASRAVLCIWVNDEAALAQLVYPLAIDALHAHDSVPGVLARLQSLGYLAMGSSAAANDDDTRCALASFQKHHGLTVTGEADDDTVVKLRDAHARA